ncbi:hypothetical protein PSMA106859_13750 [Pseudoalteromonas maricaloris]
MTQDHAEILKTNWHLTFVDNSGHGIEFCLYPGLIAYELL